VIIQNSSSNNIHSISCIYIWNTNLGVLDENQVFTDSRVLFWCHAYLHDSNIDWDSIEIEMENFDDENDILTARKGRRNDGDK